jgi:hypothetical protein
VQLHNSVLGIKRKQKSNGLLIDQSFAKSNIFAKGNIFAKVNILLNKESLLT